MTALVVENCVCCFSKSRSWACSECPLACIVGLTDRLGLWDAWNAFWNKRKSQCHSKVCCVSTKPFFCSCPPPFLFLPFLLSDSPDRALITWEKNDKWGAPTVVASSIQLLVPWVLTCAFPLSKTCSVLCVELIFPPRHSCDTWDFNRFPGRQYTQHPRSRFLYVSVLYDSA